MWDKKRVPLFIQNFFAVLAPKPSLVPSRPNRNVWMVAAGHSLTTMVDISDAAVNAAQLPVLKR